MDLRLTYRLFSGNSANGIEHHPIWHLATLSGVPMPRLRLRLATFGLLIVIIALATALFVQWRREAALKSRMQDMNTQIRVLESIVALKPKAFGTT